MAKTYTQLREQMEALLRRMEAAKRKEGAGVLKDIKKQIAHYGFTPEDVFGNDESPAERKRASKPPAEAAPKYQDAHGNSWSGRGPRPGWLRTALESGASLESFLSAPSTGAGAASDDAVRGAVKKRRAGAKTAGTKKTAAKKTVAKKTARGAKASAVSRDARGSGGAPAKGRRGAAAPKGPARPAAKKRRTVKSGSARQGGELAPASQTSGAQTALA